MMTSMIPAHQKSAFSVGKWSPKLHSIFPLAWDQRSSLLVPQNTLFWNYSNLNSAWSILESTPLKLLQLNIRRHGLITHAHSMTCRRTSFSMQSVSYPKVYSLETSTPEGPQRTGPAPWWHMFHPFTLLHFHLLHTTTSLPKIHRLLKLRQLNLSDTITCAHLTTFPHVLAVTQSILFGNYFA